MKAYRITQWEGSHETHESRKLKFLPWCASPNKHDGLAFSYLKAEPEQEKIELVCAWKLMVDIAGRAVREQRGWLIRSGKALTATDLSMMTSFPARIFEKAFVFFCRPEVSWMEEQEVPPETFELPLVAPHSPGTPAAPANVPADSPGTPAAPATGLPESGTISPTDRQTDRQDRTDRQDQNNKKGLLRSNGAGPSLAEVSASKTQWASLTARQTELKGKSRAAWSDSERVEWQKNRADLKKLGEKQRAGVFA